MRHSVALIAICLAMSLLVSSAGLAEVPRAIHQQGFLTDTDGPVNGEVSLTFKIYAGAVEKWSATLNNVPVTNGVYSVVLNVSGLAFDVPYFVGVSVNGGLEMQPRQALTSAPYAIQAETAETVLDNAITSASVLDGSLTGADMSSDARITAGQIDTTNLNADTVDNQHAADLQVRLFRDLGHAVAEIFIDKNGTISLTDTLGSTIRMDVVNSAILMKDVNGNSMTMNSSGTRVEDLNGQVIEMAAQGISVQGTKIVIKSGNVHLGDEGGEPIIKGTSFLSLFASHIHTTAPVGGGPTSPPIPQGEGSTLSTMVRAQ